VASLILLVVIIIAMIKIDWAKILDDKVGTG